MTDLHQRNGDTKESIDYVLLILVLLLVVFGLVVLYSTSAYNGRVKFADPAYYLRKQFFATSIGLFSMYLVSCMDYRRLQNYAWIGYGIALMLSTAVLFVGREYNGSKRWLALGPLSFQPSEYAKLAVVVLLAAIVSRNASHMKSWKYMFLVILLILPVVGLVGSNNLSTGNYYSWNRSNPDLCCKSTVFTFSMDRRHRSGIHRYFPESGILPAGTAGHLAESGIIRKRISDHAGTLCYRFWRTLRCWIGRKHAEAGLCARGTERYDLFNHL